MKIKGDAFSRRIFNKSKLNDQASKARPLRIWLASIAYDLLSSQLQCYLYQLHLHLRGLLVITFLCCTRIYSNNAGIHTGFLSRGNTCRGGEDVGQWKESYRILFFYVTPRGKGQRNSEWDLKNAPVQFFFFLERIWPCVWSFRSGNTLRGWRLFASFVSWLARSVFA